MMPTLEQTLGCPKHREGRCFLFTQELSKHALLHMTWDEIIFSCQPSAIASQALSAFPRDMTCNRLGLKIYCHLLSRQIKSLINAGMVHGSG
jgi:hypothetical protein